MNDQELINTFITGGIYKLSVDEMIRLLKILHSNSITKFISYQKNNRALIYAPVNWQGDRIIMINLSKIN